MDKREPLPVIVYYHGGGFVLADLDTYDATPRETSKAVKAIVVSVEYRHAPENKFPAAHDDAFNAYKWVVDNAASFGGDPKRIAVMGESAGGNLAINTAIAARDNNVQMPVHEALIYPLVGTDMDTPSYNENANAKPLNKPMMKWFAKHLINHDADLQDPRLDVVEKADLKGLPPTTVIADQIDPLRSEDEALAEKLKVAGVKVDAKTYKGMTHEFFGMGAVVAKAKDAEDRVNGDLESGAEKVNLVCGRSRGYWRALAHKHDADPAVTRIFGVVGHKWLAVGETRDAVDAIIGNASLD